MFRQSRLAAAVAIVVAAAVAPAALVAQTATDSTSTQKYANGDIKSQTTTTTLPSGTKTHQTKTDYDKSGHPTHEMDTSYRDGTTIVQKIEQTWVYDEKGRLIFYEKRVWTIGNENVGSSETGYRLRKSYDGDKDKEGKVESEEISDMAGGYQWREFDGESGDSRPDMRPKQPLPEKPNGKPAEGKPSSDDNELPLPKSKVKLLGKIGWEHTPNEPVVNNLGAGGGIAWRLTPTLSAIAEVTRVAGSRTNSENFTVSFARLSLLGGVQYDWPAHGRVVPFVRGMAGVVHDRTSFGPATGRGNGLQFAAVLGLAIGGHGRWELLASFDERPTHFPGQWQAAFGASGGAAYSIGNDDGGPTPAAGGAINVGLENPYTTELSRLDAEVRRAKPAYDRAEKEIAKCDPEWMKKNLTPDGQKDVDEAKGYEREAKAGFEKAAEGLRKAQADDDRLQTQDSGAKVNQARADLKKATRSLDGARRHRIRTAKDGMTKEAKKNYTKIQDAYWIPMNEYEKTKIKHDEWNKAHGIK